LHQTLEVLLAELRRWERRGAIDGMQVAIWLTVLE